MISSLNMMEYGTLTNIIVEMCLTAKDDEGR